MCLRYFVCSRVYVCLKRTGIIFVLSFVNFRAPGRPFYFQKCHIVKNVEFIFTRKHHPYCIAPHLFHSNEYCLHIFEIFHKKFQYSIFKQAYNRQSVSFRIIYCHFEIVKTNYKFIGICDIMCLCMRLCVCIIISIRLFLFCLVWKCTIFVAVFVNSLV